MEIHTIKATHCDLTDDMRTVIEGRMSSLNKFVHDGTSHTLEVEVEKTNNREQGQEYRGEANLTINGKFYRAEAYGENVEGAFDEVQNELKKELRRAKGKEENLFRKGARQIKDFIRFGRE